MLLRVSSTSCFGSSFCKQTVRMSRLRSPLPITVNQSPSQPPETLSINITSNLVPRKFSSMDKKIEYILDERVAAFPKVREDLLKAYPDITDTICGGFIFTRKPLKFGEDDPKSSSLRVLILHRAATLPANQYPGTWDYPGGRFETSDANILDAVAREVHEETGLHVSKFHSYADLVTWVKGPEYGSRKWGKFCFIVEVAELDNADDLESLHVKYSPNEHQGHAWVTVDELKDYDFIGADKGESIKAAFAKL